MKKNKKMNTFMSGVGVGFAGYRFFSTSLPLSIRFLASVFTLSYTLRSGGNKSGSGLLAISRSCSSKRDEPMDNINSLFEDNQFSLFLNPIASIHREETGSDKFTPNKDFIVSFVDVLKVLDKSYSYDFKFSLFLHTNDRGKELVYFMVESPYDSYLFSEHGVPTEEKLMRMMGHTFLYKFFEFRGYFTYINYSNIDLNSIKDFIRYASDILIVLGGVVVDVNEISHEDGFIEFHKPVLLKITRSSHCSEESRDDSNKSDGFYGYKSLLNECAFPFFQKMWRALSYLE